MLPYTNNDDFLRDELWRVWLRVAYQLQELHAHRAPDSVGSPDSGSLAAAFRQAHAEYAGAAEPSDSGSSQLKEAFLAHSVRIEERVAATYQAGRRLPLPEVGRRFQLTRWQQAALTFVLMPELDPGLLFAYRQLVGDPSLRGVDVRLLAMLVYDTPESRARLALDLSPRSPLIYYRLVEFEELAQRAEALLLQRLRPAARLVQMLSGDSERLDPALYELAELRTEAPKGMFSEPALQRIEAALRPPDILLVLRGSRGAGKRWLLSAAAARAGKRTLLIDTRTLCQRPPELGRAALRSLLREAKLLDALPVFVEVDLAIAESDGGQLPQLLTAFCTDHYGPVAMTFTGERLPLLPSRPVVSFELPVPGLAERKALWRLHMDGLPEEVAATLAERFALPPGVISLTARAAHGLCADPDHENLLSVLDGAVRDQLHDRLARLGKRLETPHTFDDLVVDNTVWDTLWEIVARSRVRRTMRYRYRISGPAGLTVLFSGDPGVGKTMSAVVLARELGLSIYEIDLSQIMSKWVGETEKNLAEVFEAAEPGHVILLFNEADSLFGKRSAEVNSAQDRHANLETNYLLQRIERFSGLAILTTNLTSGIDPAFRRRFTYEVFFPFPTAELRAEIWRRAIPLGTQSEPIDFCALAERYEFSGGFIKAAAERSLYIAMALRRPLSESIIIPTIERMYQERGKLAAVGMLE